MKPLNGTCFIRPEFHEMSESGLIDISQMHYKHLPGVGKVTHLPAGEFDFKVGDRVIYDHRQSDIAKVDPKYTGNLTVAVVPVVAVMAVIGK